MGRDSYDDMVGPDRKPRRQGGGRRLALITLLCVLVLVIGVLVYLILAPAPQEETAPAPAQTPLSVSVKEPEILESQLSQPAVGAPARDDGPVEPEVVAPVENTSPAPSTSTSASNSPSSARTTALAIEGAGNLAAWEDGSRLAYISHTVQEGEDLSSIAELYGLEVGTLTSVNRIRDLNAVTPGVRLRIPNMDGQLYTVQDGDMLSTIALKFDPSLGWRTLMDINGLSSENIRVGDELFIPSSNDDDDAVLPQSTSVTFSLPIATGRLSSSFGERVDDIQLQGVLVTAEAGSPVLAAAPGVVVDSGNSASTGRFLVIQHEQGYKTTYAFLDSVSAAIGDSVEAGSQIGTLGTNSRFSRPTLYFQIEQGGISLDPSLFF